MKLRVASIRLCDLTEYGIEKLTETINHCNQVSGTDAELIKDGEYAHVWATRVGTYLMDRLCSAGMTIWPSTESGLARVADHRDYYRAYKPYDHSVSTDEDPELRLLPLCGNSSIGHHMGIWEPDDMIAVAHYIANMLREYDVSDIRVSDLKYNPGIDFVYMGAQFSIRVDSVIRRDALSDHPVFKCRGRTYRSKYELRIKLYTTIPRYVFYTVPDIRSYDVKHPRTVKSVWSQCAHKHLSRQVALDLSNTIGSDYLMGMIQSVLTGTCRGCFAVAIAQVTAAHTLCDWWRDRLTRRSDDPTVSMQKYGRTFSNKNWLLRFTDVNTMAPYRTLDCKRMPLAAIVQTDFKNFSYLPEQMLSLIPEYIKVMQTTIDITSIPFYDRCR